ncbi:hypothetical protein I3F58_05750 [Streptomyces sp. MUM 203J]|uniref:hypothetical protein n=1 Tax=Streptomyces sp. MUM 203J TaxID=2791990 RepID=UPI001F03FC36|nr:hypothetical protein [Streptomyces sp. MUM 203J]MCH0539067.1 hypothetical protein [Streptomyces sp. MUM 203J]
MALFRRRAAGKPGEWYYCLEHEKVEEGPECPAKNRLGPYGTAGEASHALELARERTVQWESDPHWTDTPGGEPPEPGPPAR